MLLHVIWGLVDEIAQDCPTFSVTGVMVEWEDRVPAHVNQSVFRWSHNAWEADIDVHRVGGATPLVSGVLRLSPAVLKMWTGNSVNPRSECARQLRDVIRGRKWSTDLVVTLK